MCKFYGQHEQNYPLPPEYITVNGEQVWTGDAAQKVCSHHKEVLISAITTSFYGVDHHSLEQFPKISLEILPEFLEWTIKQRAESLKADLLKKPDMVKYPDSMRDYKNVNAVIRWAFYHRPMFFFEWVESMPIMREAMNSLMAFLADKEAVVASGETLGK